MSPTKRSVRVTYTRAPYHHTAFADGVVTQITGSGQLSMNFYVGQYDLFEEKIQLDEEGNVETQETIVPIEVPMIREVQATILMSVETAQSLRDVLTQKLEEIKKIKGETK